MTREQGALSEIEIPTADGVAEAYLATPTY